MVKKGKGKVDSRGRSSEKRRKESKNRATRVRTNQLAEQRLRKDYPRAVVDLLSLKDTHADSTATFDRVRAERDELRKLMLGKLDTREQAMLELKAAKEAHATDLARCAALQAHATDLARCAALEKELGEVK